MLAESLWENKSKAPDDKGDASEEDAEFVKAMGLDIQALIKEQDGVTPLLMILALHPVLQNWDMGIRIWRLWSALDQIPPINSLRPISGILLMSLTPPSSAV